MERGFFRSREFAASAAVAGLVLAAGAWAMIGAAWGSSVFEGDVGCDPPIPDPLARRVDLVRGEATGARTRVLAATVDAAQAQGGRVGLCNPFGGLVVGPSPDGRVHVTFRLAAPEASSDAPLDGSDVRVTLREEDGRLALAAWPADLGTYATGPGSRRAVQATLEVLLPTHLAWDLDASSGAGDLEVAGVRLRDLRLENDFGETTADALDLSGNLTVHAGSGTVTVRLASVQSGLLQVEADFGDATLELPARADVGYDVRASSDFGRVQVQVGPAEAYESDGHAMHVRTAGYASKPTQVRVVVENGSGDVRVATAGAPP